MRTLITTSYTPQLHGNKYTYYFSFKSLKKAYLPWGHFHFLRFIYFQTVFSVLSSNSDASTYFQIETPRMYFFFKEGSMNQGQKTSIDPKRDSVIIPTI